jgi:hypothetical protein
MIMINYDMNMWGTKVKVVEEKIVSSYHGIHQTLLPSSSALILENSKYINKEVEI